MDKPIIKSGTAVGFGSAKWRYVKELSAQAQTALANRTALVICPRPFNDVYGRWYVVTLHWSQRGARYGHRLPKRDEARQIQAWVAAQEGEGA